MTELGNLEFAKSCIEQNVLYGNLEHNSFFMKNKQYQVFTNNLRLRTAPGTGNSSVITLLKLDEVVTLLEVGKYELINSLPGEWVKVKTGKNKSGWCFGAYLADYMENN